ncbi:unnamed protein product [Adineta ricciae]|nr:unnamed protein product [Adineta ricciae]
MLQLSKQVQTNLGDLSWIVAARSFGFILSIVFFGIIFQSIPKYHSDSLLAIGYLLPTFATALTPHLTSLWTLCLALLSQGMLQGISDLAINTLITKMWLEDSTSPLNCVYLGYPIGALLSIIIVRIFHFSGGIEQSFTKFFLSFLEKQNLISDQNNVVYPMIFYWFSMLIGRIICTYLTMSLFSPEIMLTISLFFSLLTYIIWIILLWYFQITLFTVDFLIILNGLSISTISPTFIGWIKHYLVLSPIELAFLLSSNALGGFVFGLISGYVFQFYGSKHLFTVLIITMIFCSISFLLSWFYQNFNSKKHQHIEKNSQAIHDDHLSINFIDQD